MTNDKCRKKSEFPKSEQPDQGVAGIHWAFGFWHSFDIGHWSLVIRILQRLRSPDPAQGKNKGMPAIRFPSIIS